MGGVSIISGTPKSASGTISDLKNNYAHYYHILFFYTILFIFTFVNIPNF